MELQGTVRNGSIVLDDGPTLPEGTRVEVSVKAVAESNSETPSLSVLLKYSGLVTDLPTDMARNHDHYLHGAPKR